MPNKAPKITFDSHSLIQICIVSYKGKKERFYDITQEGALEKANKWIKETYPDISEKFS